MSNDWDCYLSSTDDGPISFFLDLDASPDRDELSRPHVCRITVALASASEYGLATREEDEVLFRVEDALELALKDSFQAAFVGRATHGGKRVFFFYLPATSAPIPAIERVFSAFPLYKWRVLVEADPEWLHYSEFLYPDDEDWQIIMNARVVRNLMDNGDALTEPRRIDHWLYFPSRSAGAAFKKTISGMGFTVLNEAPDQGSWKIQIHRVDSVAPEAIDALTLELFRHARTAGGHYDGWETAVIT